MASHISLKKKIFTMLALALTLFLQDILGEVICEDIGEEKCAFAVSATGRRCVLEKQVKRSGEEAFVCRTSEIEAGKLKDRVETDECIAMCGVDRMSLGISSDSLFESHFTQKLCSFECYSSCPNIVDLYFNLAAGEVPVFLYGAAHEEGRALDSIRRELQYFKPNSSGGLWAGGPKSEPLPLKPDEGPVQVAQAKGVVVIGATKWVDNYNIPVFSTDVAIVRRIAKRVSGRGGGLPSVQAMALAHGKDVIEVACNLLEPCRVGGDQVQIEVEWLAKEEGVAVGKGYFTDFSEEEIIEKFLKLGSVV
ncbi:uncharacterized protein LOC131146617 isoform X1 [Malania oleifera]|uniref:uncharacterized protein LOC131146617 isoform X1 n=1 Tax=Malania oleifera TaxID=397392 RepID=UPI0025AE0BA7|nr:uncharacterized protein LOC131146617 isoform X1 [Malania oleifera]